MIRVHYARLNANLKRKYGTLSKHHTATASRVVVTSEQIEAFRVAKAEAEIKQGQSQYENHNHLPNRFGT